VPSLYGQPHVTYTPEGANATAVDLSCFIRPGITFDSPIETGDDPVLCDPTRSRVRAGAASVTMTLVIGDDYATAIGSLLGTSGRLEARVPDEDGPGFGADVSWPASHGVAFTDDAFLEAEITLGAGGIEYLPAVTAP
jgi:hypothetical protein